MSRIDEIYEACLALVQDGPPSRLEGPGIAPGSLWVARASGRRARILWATEAGVCLSYDETRVSARQTHSVPAFFRLYSEVKENQRHEQTDQY